MRHMTSRARAPITIGLVNNMPDAALLATERQFMRLVGPSSQAHHVHLRLFYLPEIARSDAARMQLNARYAPIDALARAGVDALIVTGCEPVRPSLRDEPYWPSLARLVDWAKDNTFSTIWSCLAAHVAVLHLDGIKREKLARKLAGVYKFERMSEHPLLHDVNAPVHTPHSRLNGLNASDLIQHDYELLTHSDQAGADAFIKQYESLFVFLQGHPEYEPDSLYREYRRDMMRFLAGQQPACPALPENCFDAEARVALEIFAKQAQSARTAEFIGGLPAIEETRFSSGWYRGAARLFANWISYIAEVRTQSSRVAGGRERVTSSVTG